MRHAPLPALTLVFGALALLGCDRPPALAPDVGPTAGAPMLASAAATEVGPEACALTRTDFTLASLNPYFPIDVGNWWVYTGFDDGELLVLNIRILNETEVVGGVVTRVLEEREWIDGELLEVSRNYYVATGEGTICYLGEAVDIYEDGEVVSHEGAWRADEPGNAPGVIMPARPTLGVKYRNENAPGIAEDEAEVVAVGLRVRVPAGTFRGVIRVREENPLDGDVGFKLFAPREGLILDGPARLIASRNWWASRR